MLAAGMLSIGAVVEYLNFSGYCYPQGRWLGDQELVEAAKEPPPQQAVTQLVAPSAA